MDSWKGGKENRPWKAHERAVSTQTLTGWGSSEDNQEYKNLPAVITIL